jgi:uncharacterized protein (DUF983 family)
MLYQQSALYSILNNKCPRCHKGNFFENNNPYNLKKFDKMHKHCPVCNEDFERETGYYYGAMFASYALTVIFGVLVFVIMCVVFNFDAMTFLIVFAILQLLLMPIFYRVSRLMWINIFVRYKKPLKE